MLHNGLLYISVDTEFISNNLTPTGLISLGLHTELASYYAVNADMDTELTGLNEDSKTWMKANVFPHLPMVGGNLELGHPDVKSHAQIAREVDEFFERAFTDVGYDMEKIRAFAHCGAQDMVRLHTLWDNDWSRMPGWIPNFFDDVKRMRIDAGLRWEELLEQKASEQHHALLDAKHEMKVVQQLLAYAGGRDGAA